MQASIIIPTYNRANQLSRAMKSLIELNFNSSQYEIIVIDNGSKDGTRQVVEKYISEYHKNTIRYFYDNIPGLLTGRHRGAKEAKSEILIFIDDDICADKGWLGAIVDTFERYPDVSIVGGKCLPLYEISPPDWLDYFWQHIPGEGKMLCDLSLCDFGDKEKSIDPTWVFGLNFSIRREALYELGGFHPDCISSNLQYYQGDGETGLSLSAIEKGYGAFYQPKALVHHEVASSRMTLEYFDKRYFYAGVCNSYTEVRRNKGFKYTILIFGKMKSTLRSLYEIIVLRNTDQNKTGNFEKKYLQIRFEAMERAGYEFHQKMARKFPIILNWILKENYFNYKLPKI